MKLIIKRMHKQEREKQKAYREHIARKNKLCNVLNVLVKKIEFDKMRVLLTKAKRNVQKKSQFSKIIIYDDVHQSLESISCGCRCNSFKELVSRFPSIA